MQSPLSAFPSEATIRARRDGPPRPGDLRAEVRAAPPAPPARPATGRVAVVATAALTSACVSVFTVWLLGSTFSIWAPAGSPRSFRVLPATPPLPTLAPAMPSTTPVPPAVAGDALETRTVEVLEGDRAQPAPVQAGAKVTVVTEPAGARVTINGVGWGVTPLTIDNLPPGEKHIRVTRAGYVSEERVVRLEAPRGAAVRVALRESPPPPLAR